VRLRRRPGQRGGRSRARPSEPVAPARLLEAALEHSRTGGYRAVFLWTFDALAAAARLYESVGFFATERLAEAAPSGVPIIEVRYDLAAPFGGSRPELTSRAWLRC
jgi:hypothetical protein